GFNVFGIDYSESGCEQARHILSDAGVEGEIVCADLFSPPSSLRRRFDVVVSFGVVEHFSPPWHAIKAFAEFLVPGALLVTVIPNLRGVMGPIEKLLNPAVYAAHVPLTTRELRAAHDAAGLSVLSSSYFLSTN